MSTALSLAFRSRGATKKPKLFPGSREKQQQPSRTMTAGTMAVGAQQLPLGCLIHCTTHQEMRAEPRRTLERAVLYNVQHVECVRMRTAGRKHKNAMRDIFAHRSRICRIKFASRRLYAYVPHYERHIQCRLKVSASLH